MMVPVLWFGLTGCTLKAGLVAQTLEHNKRDRRILLYTLISLSIGIA